MATYSNVNPVERVGETFSEEKLMSAQRRAWKVLAQVASLIKEGMTEKEIENLAKELYEKAGCEKHWHRPIARIGKNTLCIFSGKSDPDVVLQKNDICFLDFGPLFDGHEADVGATVVVGEDPEMERMANSASALFGEVAEAFKKGGMSGKELYAFAEERAKAMNVVFVTEVDGHRVSEFPHQVYTKAGLAEYKSVPTPKRWILEIQIRHPTKDYGAFYEDIL